MGLRLVHSAEPGDFVCPWCGNRFERSVDLQIHWDGAPVCRNNRNVNNQTQSKYNVNEPDEPSEE